MAVLLYVNTHLCLVKALNYVVYYLFTALSRGLSTVMKLGELNVFTGAMRLYQQNYNGIGLMCDYIVKALGYLEYEQIENMRGLQHLRCHTNTWR
jgi:hypothetical protein